MPPRNKGKFGKHGGGGGGRKYVANAEELEKREGKAGGVDSDEEDSEEEESDDEGGEEGAGGGGGAGETVFQFRPKAERDALRGGEAPASAAVPPSSNPNRAKKGSGGIKVKDLGLADGEEEGNMSRKEREAAEAERAKEAYMKKHLAGETEQARKDLERLAIVKARREAEAAKRALTGRKAGMSANGLDMDDGEGGKSVPEPEPVISEAAAAKKAAALQIVDDSSESQELPVLKAIDIKKMNPEAMKEALKARGLSIQGNKKDLTTRLTDHEKARS